MNLYKKPLSSSQYCHTEEEAVTNIHKVFFGKRMTKKAKNSRFELLF